jgi:hypothetical protein
MAIRQIPENRITGSSGDDADFRDAVEAMNE